MEERATGSPDVRPLSLSDITASLRYGVREFLATPAIGLFFAGFYVIAGLVMAWITYETGHTFWLILAVLGFPLVGTLAALGFYETSRRRQAGEPVAFGDVLRVVWAHRSGQLPWLAAIIIVLFLFWFFLGHMIFALFLGLAPMTNVTTSLDVFLGADGLMMLGFGTVVGAVFAAIVFGVSVLGMPMLMDREVDFITAMIRSLSAVMASPVAYGIWACIIGIVTLLAMLPFFLGLFIVMPVFGHATWHLYKTVTTDP